MFDVTPINEEVIYDGRPMITETDLRGKIVYMNRKFIEMSGYDRHEILGKPHSVVRHPDMPREAFCCMWDTIKEGNMWSGFVKNLRKDGRYYWVEVIIEPILNDKRSITGYCASRRPVKESDKKYASEMFQKLKCGEIEHINLHREMIQRG